MSSEDRRSSEPRRQERAGDAAFDEIGWGEGPEFIERDLLGLWALYCSDPSTNIAAFEAIHRIAVHWWDDRVEADRPDKNFGLNPTASVPVPWWVVHLMGQCWRSYKDNTQRTVGEAFLLEGGGKGRHKAITQLERQQKEMRLALEIAYRRRAAAKEKPRKNMDTIIQEVATEYALAEDTVRAYWKKHNKSVKSALDRWQSRIG
jgi:hypothetical protein